MSREVHHPDLRRGDAVEQHVSNIAH